MFCPKCGNAEQKPNSFCRQCGEFLPDLTKNNALAFGGNTPQEKNLSTYYLSLTGFLASLIVTIALFLTGFEDKKIIIVAAAVLIINIFTQAGIFYLSLKMKNRLGGKSEAENLNSISGEQTPNLLTDAVLDEFISLSVTENTTENLVRKKTNLS